MSAWYWSPLARWLYDLGGNDQSIMRCDLCDAAFIWMDIAAQMRDDGGAVCLACAERASTI